MISVIITCFKEGVLLKEAIQSLQAQTYKNFEILVVNDCSPDKLTNAICQELETKKVANVIWRETNGGLAAARNSGYEAMSGQIAVLLDADDVLPANAIQDIYEGFNKHTDADFIFGNYIRKELHEDTETIVRGSLISNTDGSINIVKLSRNWTLLGTSPCKKALWQKLQGYSSEYTNDYQDLDFWMRSLVGGAKGYYIDATIYQWNRSAVGMNFNAGFQKLYQVYLDNITFYDKAEYGKEIRQRIMRYFLKQHDYRSAAKLYRSNKRFFDKGTRRKILTLKYPSLYKVYSKVKQLF